jgi:hypothetical protein
MKFLIFSYLLSFTKAISTRIIKKCAINCHNSYIFQPFPENNAYITRNSSKCRLFEAYQTSDEDLYINFCGSQNVKDWMINSDALMKTNDDNFKFHSGFLKLSKKIEETDEYLRVKDRILYSNNIIFTGHSRGSAIASLLALHASRTFKYSKIKLVTFAIPNVASIEFFEDLEENVEQKHYVFEDDILCNRGLGSLSVNYKTFLDTNDYADNIFQKHNMKRYISAFNKH